MGQEGASKFPGFPYKPYSIQIDFMNALYHSLDKGGVSMLESPTGTGKTLSIICSALQWVLDQRGEENLKIPDNSPANQRSEGQVGCNDEPSWLSSFDANKSNQLPKKKIKEKELVDRSEKKDKGRNQGNCRDLYARGEERCSPMNKQSEKLQKKNDAEELCDGEFLLEDYESEEERALGGGKSKRKPGGISISSSSDEEGEEDETYEEEDDEEGMKVYFCSRTHSQLSQFIQELRKTVFAYEIKVVSLGSRKNLCINEEVLKLGNSTPINELCLELQKNKKSEASKIKYVGAEGRRHRTKASSGCPMLRKHQLQGQFRVEASQNGALDIEDLVHLGRSLGTCPYYASRSMVRGADLVVLPYQSLLSKSSRESLGLNLKNNIVIIDEAHNLADSLISMYDAKITLLQLETVHSHIENYLGRFRNLLGPGNRRYIQTLMVITRALLQSLLEKDVEYVNTSKDAEKADGSVNAFDSSMAINDFLFSLNIDNINMIKLVRYIKESNIIHKVSGYGAKVSRFKEGLALKDSGESSEEESSLAGFRALVDMLLSLINKDSDGRMIISRARPTCSGLKGGYLKYVMLTGERIFSEIAEQAHAIVLAGGTLQPIEETRDRLFPWLPLGELHFFSCNHIVPPENILTVAVSYGPTGRSFDFSYNSRSLPTVIEELGLLLCNLVTVVPEGIVVFFSSFEYEGKVYEAWKKSGILERILKKKHVFREPRKNIDVEIVLKQYKEIIDMLSKRSKEHQGSLNGAILLAVVGGKISEGINFSDGMGRCIVMVGLPYPNPSDIELMERMKHIEGLGQSNSTNHSVHNEYYDGDIQAAFGILRSCKHRGKEYYENLCMKSVNQSIGRAIRHINDYATILLVDKRYASDSSKRSFSDPTNKLPQWIKNRLVSATDNYGEVHRLLHQFFRFNKHRVCHK